MLPALWGSPTRDVGAERLATTMNASLRKPDEKPGRNDPCACGSGKKYKKCCAVAVAAEHAAPSRAEAPGRAEMNELASLLNAGRHWDLETRARELLTRFPDSGPVLKFLGAALWAQGKDALPSLQRVTELLPHDAEAHSNLGNAYRAVGRSENAIRCQREALALHPDYAQAHNNLGSALQDLGYLDEAIGSFQHAVTLKPDFALAHCNLGNALLLSHRIDEAETSCRRALELNPALTAALVQWAEVRAARGDFTAADELLKRAIAVEPDLPEAWAGFVRWRKMTAGDGAWLSEARRIAGSGLAPRREVHLRYALGKYFDDVGEYEQAFANYRRANELAKIGRPAHERQQVTQGIDRIVQFYDGEWLDRAGRDANLSERPVFIVGMPRSGTTLAEQILAAHAAAFGAGELPFWNSAAVRYAASRAGGEDEGAIGGDLAARSGPRAFADEYLSVLAGLSPEAQRVVDKMPGNFLYLGLIHAALPKARIIHLQRNPLDTCLSIYFQNFGVIHSYAHDLEDLAHYYGEYLRVMEHWRVTLPPGVLLEVPYEGLVAEPEAWSRRMVEFVGLPWDPTCLEFHRSTRPVSTFSKWQARQSIHTSSVERWKNYEQFVAPLRRFTGQPSE